MTEFGHTILLLCQLAWVTLYFMFVVEEFQFEDLLILIFGGLVIRVVLLTLGI